MHKRIDCRPNKYFSFQLAYVDFGQKYIICFISYAYPVQWNMSKADTFRNNIFVRSRQVSTL